MGLTTNPAIVRPVAAGSTDVSMPSGMKNMLATESFQPIVKKAMIGKRIVRILQDIACAATVSNMSAS
jgi:hypothetical protein